MVISDKIIYFELFKTGSSHTRRILSSMFPNSHTIVKKHNTYDSVPKTVLGNFEEKIKIGNVRNPWDWYVSLWAFGCQGTGRFTNVLLNKRPFLNKITDPIAQILGRQYPWLAREVWKKLYSDPENYEHFNTWLKLLLSDKKFTVGEGYKESELSKFAGFFTYRYLMLYTDRKQLKKIDSPSKLRQYDADRNFLNIVIKNEQIHEDLYGVASELNYEKDRLTEILKQYQRRTNQSARDRNYRKYYDEESILLVEKMEQFLIEKYEYKF